MINDNGIIYAKDIEKNNINRYYIRELEKSRDTKKCKIYKTRKKVNFVIKYFCKWAICLNYIVT